MAIDFKDFQKLKWYYQLPVVVGVCSGLLALLWYQFLTPIEADITAKESHLSGLQQTIAKSVQQQKQFAEFKKQAMVLQVKLDSLKSVLPLEKETDALLRQVQKSAETSALRVLRIGPRPVIEHEVYTEWPIDMQIVGTYHNIGEYLDKIRQLPRIVNITGLKIQSRASEGPEAFSSSVSATYTATTFVYREEQSPPPVAK